MVAAHTLAGTPGPQLQGWTCGAEVTTVASATLTLKADVPVSPHRAPAADTRRHPA